ncbi:MAG: hypothetical protein WAV13_03970 [Thermodesulfovibrionales bacterium]
MSWDQLVVTGAAAVGVVSFGATLHARATMVGVESRIAVLEDARKATEKKLDEIAKDVKELLRLVK